MITDHLNRIVPVSTTAAGNGAATGPSSYPTGVAVTTDNQVGDVIDLRRAQDVAIGQAIYLVITVTETFTGTTSIEFLVKASSNNSTIEAGDATVATTGSILVAQLVRGAQFVVRLQLPVVPETGSTIGAQYLGVFADVNVTATAGKVLVDFVLDPQTRHIDYPKGFVTGD